MYRRSITIFAFALASIVLPVMGFIALRAVSNPDMTSANSSSKASTTMLPAGFEESLSVPLGFNPTSMAFARDGRLFVSDQAGDLRVVDPGGALQATPFLSVPVISSDERGLLGVAVDPDFETNGYVYIYYTSSSTGRNQLSRFQEDRANPGQALPGSELVLLDLGFSASGYHNGGALHFGTDGYLYLGIGDAHSGSNAGDLTNLAGKLLRIASDGSIPITNPHSGQPNSRQEIFAHGFRNPFTFAVNPSDGTIYVNDVGQSTWEEINLVVPGDNYGWDRCEGDFVRGSTSTPCDDPAARGPIFAYPSDGPCAITGGVFGQGPAFPSGFIDGEYYFADFCAGWIKRRQEDGTVVDFAQDTAGLVVDLDFGPDRALYYLSRETQAVYRIAHAALAAQAEPSLDLHRDSADGAIGLKVGIAAIIEPAGGNNGAALIRGYRAQIAYDATCLELLEVRDLDFIARVDVNDREGIATIRGDALEPVAAPAGLAHALTRLQGSNQVVCPLDLEIIELTGSDENSIALVPSSLTHSLLRGDARSDGEINPGDVTVLARYLLGLEDDCTTTADTGCLHSVNTASVRQDGGFDQTTVADALFIAQYLAGLRDVYYHPVRQAVILE
jgi:glucose/arabinose dehydrogenase